MFTFLPKTNGENQLYVEDYYESDHKNWFEHPNYVLFGETHKTISRLLKKENFKLLDVGSGRGDLLNHLRTMSPTSYLCGIDVARCNSKNFNFILDDFVTTDINDTFDVITSLACIEHVADPDTFVRKMRQLILPGGLIVIMTVDSGGLMYQIARMFNKIGIHAGYRRLYSKHHIHHFTNQSLRLLLEKHRFKIISQKNHNYDLASVDFPSANFVTKSLYKILTAIIFSISSLLNKGMLQTVVCVPIDQDETKP